MWSQRKGKGLDLELNIFVQNFVEYSLDVIEHFTLPTKKLPSPVLFVQCDILGKVHLIWQGGGGGMKILRGGAENF